MNAPKYLILAWLALSVISTIRQVGRPREPITPSIAAAVFVVAVGLGWLVVLA